MKYRSVALFFIIVSLFLLCACHYTVTAGPGTTVKLMVPNLPSGGCG